VVCIGGGRHARRGTLWTLCGGPGTTCGASSSACLPRQQAGWLPRVLACGGWRAAAPGGGAGAARTEPSLPGPRAAAGPAPRLTHTPPPSLCAAAAACCSCCLAHTRSGPACPSEAACIGRCTQTVWLWTAGCCCCWRGLRPPPRPACQLVCGMLAFYETIAAVLFPCSYFACCELGAEAVWGAPLQGARPTEFGPPPSLSPYLQSSSTTSV
jgi:hypothetical protein